MTNHSNVEWAKDVYFFHGVLLEAKETDVKQLLTVMFLFISFGTIAECRVVGDMRGIGYSERSNFHPEEDGFSGTFIIKTSGEDASITYSGTDAGGMTYKALSKSSIVGIGTSGETQRVINSWVIHPIGAVLMSKTISDYGNMDSIKAFARKVKRKC